VRWYGVAYLIAFVLAWVVLRALARRRLWPVEPERVADVLFWGIAGVIVGGRVGYMIFYASSTGFDLADFFAIWKGGMSFHGGLLGVIVAYALYLRHAKLRPGDFYDGLAVATPLGIFMVRMANFVNAELYGRPWDGPWAMRFPRYPTEDPDAWDPAMHGFTEPRHPSQIYEAPAEGLLLFALLWWMRVHRRVGGGRVSAAFLMGYGAARFAIEFLREPDAGIGLEIFGVFSRGQLLSFGMFVAGVVVWILCIRRARSRPAAPTPAPA
jgi:phosphatidylglycerol:prolipoprotein diacylglycerol transferase